MGRFIWISHIDHLGKEENEYVIINIDAISSIRKEKYNSYYDYLVYMTKSNDVFNISSSDAKRIFQIIGVAI